MSGENRNRVALALTLISIGLLVPGLFRYMMTIEIGNEVPIVGKVMIYETTQSILQGIRTLYLNDNEFVSFLIALFSVTVPFVKAVLILSVLLFKKLPKRYQIYRFVHVIGKWSMADVFVVGVFIVFLSTSSMDGIDARLHSGFYFFLAYCLVSLLAFQFVKIPAEPEVQPEQ